MEFNYKQFLTKNKLTNQSKVKSLFENKINEEVDDDEVLDEPNIKDIKPSKSTDNLAKKQYQLATLIKRKDELVSKFKSNEISIDQYKEMIGNTPQHIKTLTADIEKLEGGELNEVTLVTPEALERMDGLINRRDLELFKNSLENITNELEQEGFELSDIKAYIQRELDEILGIYK
jgi:ribosomal protein S18